MDYFQFITLAEEEGFEYARELFILAHSRDIVDYEDFIHHCTERYDEMFGIPEFEYEGRVHYVMVESDAENCIDIYRTMTVRRALDEIPTVYHPYVKFVELSEHAYASLYDIFDDIDEIELELDNVILPPKFYVVTC